MLLTQDERLVKTGLLISSKGSEESDEDFEKKATTFISKLKEVFVFDRESIQVYGLQRIPGQKAFFYKIEMSPGRNQEFTIKMMEIMSELGIALQV